MAMQLPPPCGAESGSAYWEPAREQLSGGRWVGGKDLGPGGDAPSVVRLSDLRRLAREVIPDILSRGPLPLRTLYDSIARTFPAHCDDRVLCDCTPTARSPEWKHRVRGALQDLRIPGVIVYDAYHTVVRRGFEDACRPGPLRVLPGKGKCVSALHRQTDMAGLSTQSSRVIEARFIHIGTVLPQEYCARQGSPLSKELSCPEAPR